MGGDSDYAGDGKSGNQKGFKKMDGEMYLDDDNNSEQNFNPQGIFFTEVKYFLRRQ